MSDSDVFKKEYMYDLGVVGDGCACPEPHDDSIKDVGEVFNCTKLVFDFSHLKDFLDRVSAKLTEVPSRDELLEEDVGYIYPTVSNPGLSYEAAASSKDGRIDLDSKEKCKAFIEDEILGGKYDIQVYYTYLVGYIGSGKTTFMLHVYEKYKDDLVGNGKIPVRISYDDLMRYHEIEEAYNNWGKYVENDLRDKLLRAFSEFKKYQSKAFNRRLLVSDTLKLWGEKIFKNFSDDDLSLLYSERDVGDAVYEHMLSYDLLVIVDGFDSLSVDQLENESVSSIIEAIKDHFYFLNKQYKTKIRVIFSLRSCSYASLKSKGVLPIMFRSSSGSRVSTNSYCLSRPTLRDLVDRTLDMFFVEAGSGYWADNEQLIRDIFLALMKKLDRFCGFGPLGGEVEQVFDYNYRSALKLINYLFIHACGSVAVSRSFVSHDRYLMDVSSWIENLADHKIKEVMLLGMHRGFVNFFTEENYREFVDSVTVADTKQGVVDNLFCYMCPHVGAMSGRGGLSPFLAKIRVLQFLLFFKGEKDGNNYKLMDDVQDYLDWLGYAISRADLEVIVDLLVKTNCVRTRLTNRGAIKYKATGFAGLIIGRFITNFEYLSNVSQCSSLPPKVAGRINRKFKRHNGKLVEESGDVEGGIAGVGSIWVKEVWSDVYRFYLFLRACEDAELNNTKSIRGDAMEVYGENVVLMYRAIYDGGRLSDSVYQDLVAAGKKILKAEEKMGRTTRADVAISVEEILQEKEVVAWCMGR